MIPPRASLCLLGLFILGLHTGTCADDDAAKRELKRHQGVWIATSSTFDGQSVPENIVRSIRRIVTDDHVVWERNGKRFAGTKFVFDSTKDPKTIDVIPDGGRNRGEHILGIYKLERESITICVAAPGQPRPKEFNADKGNGCTLQVFAREKELAPNCLSGYFIQALPPRAESSSSFPWANRNQRYRGRDEPPGECVEAGGCRSLRS